MMYPFDFMFERTLTFALFEMTRIPVTAFEIIKVGKMWVKRKMRKNATITLYFNML